MASGIKVEVHKSNKAPSMAHLESELKAVACPLLDRLEKIVPRILEATGQPGLSVGVFYKHNVIINHHWGYRDVEARLKPDGDTTYCIGDLTKSFIAAIMCRLVNERQIGKSRKVAGLAPDLEREELGNTTMKHLVLQVTGFKSLDQIVMGLSNGAYVDKSAFGALFSELPYHMIRSGNRKFNYSNTGYMLATAVTENIASAGKTDKKPWHVLVKELITEPLKMHRTTANPKEARKAGGAAKGYVALPGGDIEVVEDPVTSQGCAHGPALGMMSSVNDMVEWCQDLLDAIEGGHTIVKGLGSAFKGADTPVEKKKGEWREPGRYQEGGWIRQWTPARLGLLSPNRRLASPTMGEDSPPKVMYSHTGYVRGFSTSVYLLPNEEESAFIVAMSNGTGRGDAVDWIVQDIIQTLFQMQPQVDFLDIALTAASNWTSWHRTNYMPWTQQENDGATVDAMFQPGSRCYVGWYTIMNSRKPVVSVCIDMDKEDCSVMRLGFAATYSEHFCARYHGADHWVLAPMGGDFERLARSGLLNYFRDVSECHLWFSRNEHGLVDRLKWALDGVVVEFERNPMPKEKCDS